MLESASDYLRAAKILWKQPNLGGVAVVNSAIAIEIILKSFVAQASENIRKGTVSEQYEIKGKRLHTLKELAAAIDFELYQKLEFQQHESCFEKYSNLFVQSRYPYEPASLSGHTEAPIQAGIKMFKSTIGWYKETGNTDPWVVSYPEVAGGGL